MADPLVIPNAVRYSVNMTLDGTDLSCMVDATVTGSGDRDDNLFEGAQWVLKTWHDVVRPKQTTFLALVDVSYLDLDDEFGPTGSTSSGPSGTPTWPSTGVLDEVCLPSNVAVRIDKGISGIRGLKGGRMFVPGIAESYTTQANTLTGAAITAFSTVAAGLLTNLNNHTLPGGAVLDWCVLHQPADASPSSSEISSVTIASKVRSQGRRLR